MNCKHCDRPIPADSKYCPYCGSENRLGNSERRKFRIPTNFSLRTMLLAIAIGIWILVLQNLGIIPVSQRVNVANEVEIDGSVRIDNTVDVSVVDY